MLFFRMVKPQIDAPILSPAVENLEQDTAVAAQPNLSADGAFRSPASIGPVGFNEQRGCGVGVSG